MWGSYEAYLRKCMGKMKRAEMDLIFNFDVNNFAKDLKTTTFVSVTALAEARLQACVCHNRADVHQALPQQQCH